MFTYYQCGDNETIYRLKFEINSNDREKYLSLLENYLTEMVFIGESTTKKLLEREKIEEENQSSIKVENYRITFEQSTVEDTSLMEDYLPLLVTIKTKRQFFLRSCTIWMLINLLGNPVDKIDSPFIREISPRLEHANYIDFNGLIKHFFDESGRLSPEKAYDYDSFIDLIRSLEPKISERYSRSSLISFWQGDEAERELADSIVSDSSKNESAFKKLNFEPLAKLAE